MSVHFMVPRVNVFRQQSYNTIRSKFKIIPGKLNEFRFFIIFK